MQTVTIYTTAYCPYCSRAKALLDKKSVNYTEIKVDNDPAARATMTKLAKATSVPQIWIGEQHVGGCDELYQLERGGKLDALLV